MATIDISKLQRQNAGKITSVINALSVNSAAERGEDLDSDSPLEEILYLWAQDVAVQVTQSWEKKGFNPASNTQKVEPKVITTSDVLMNLELNMPSEWVWAENGRRKGKRPPLAPIERWITYRGIDVKKVKQWEFKRKNKDGKTILYKPYKNINDTLKLRRSLAEVIARKIGKKGTIKGDIPGGGNRGWTGNRGSHFLSDVVNDKSLKKLSTALSEAVGYTIAVSIARAI